MEFLLLLVILFFGAFAVALGLRVAWALLKQLFRWFFGVGDRGAQRDKFLADYITAQQSRAQRRKKGK